MMGPGSILTLLKSVKVSGFYNCVAHPLRFEACARRCFSVGDKVRVTRLVSAADVKAFADLTGDHNPIHVNAEYAKTSTKFGRCIVHGAFLNGIISSVLAMELPGPGTIIRNQYLDYLSPAYVGEEVTVEVQITSIRHDVVRCTYLCMATARQEVVLKGHTFVYVKYVVSNTKI